MDHHEVCARHSYIALEDCIQASLRTLELLKHSSGGETHEKLSRYEIDSANVSLNQVIRTAEAIKEKLRKCGDVGENDAISNPTITSKPQHKAIEVAPEKNPSLPASPVTQHNDKNAFVNSSTSSLEPSEPATTRVRKLSTPCLTPMETAEITVRFMLVFV